MNELSLSLTYEGHKVRMVGTPEAPQWVAKDACRVLGLTTHNAGQGIPDEEKGHCNVVTPGGPQEFVTVTEAGLYRLIARSRKPNAQAFQRWLYNDVLPCIRKHGCYPAPAEAPALTAVNLRDPHQLAALALQLIEIVAEKDQVIAELMPKAEGYDALSSAQGLLSLQEAGKVTGHGPNLLQWRLETDGVLFRGRNSKLEPKQEHVEAGRFMLRVRVVDGRQYVQTLVTPKGLVWIRQRYRKAA